MPSLVVRLTGTHIWGERDSQRLERSQGLDLAGDLEVARDVAVPRKSIFPTAAAALDLVGTLAWSSCAGKGMEWGGDWSRRESQ